MDIAKQLNFVSRFAFCAITNPCITFVLGRVLLQTYLNFLGQLHRQALDEVQCAMECTTPSGRAIHEPLHVIQLAEALRLQGCSSTENIILEQCTSHSMYCLLVAQNTKVQMEKKIAFCKFL